MDNGVVEWFSRSVLQKVHSLRNSHFPVQMLRYSPDERFLVIFDGVSLSIYDPMLKYVQMGKVREVQNMLSCLIQQDKLYISFQGTPQGKVKVYELTSREKNKKGTWLEEDSNHEVRGRLQFAESSVDGKIQLSQTKKDSRSIQLTTLGPL